MSSAEYYSIWFLYLASSAVAVAGFWWLTQFIKHKTVKLLLRLPVIAIVLTPAQTSDVSFLYAPAIASAALEFIANGWEGARPHVFSVLFAVAFSLLLVLIIDVVRTRSVVAK